MKYHRIAVVAARRTTFSPPGGLNGGGVSEGEFVYEAVSKQIKQERKVTGSCIDEERRLEAKLAIKGPQGFKKIPKEPRIQLQSLRGRLAVIAYPKWDFKTLVLGKIFSNLENRTAVAYVKYPKELESGNGVWGTLGPICNRERGVEIRRISREIS